MAGMTTPENVTQSDKNPEWKPGDPIAWVEIHADGGEIPASGAVWSPAAPLSGVGRAFWVLQDPSGPQEAASAVLVAVTSTRHQCGRVVRGRWAAKGGRFVDQGEIYRQPDPRSKFGVRERPAAPPRAIRLKPMHASARNEYDAYLALVADLTPERAQ